MEKLSRKRISASAGLELDGKEGRGTEEVVGVMTAYVRPFDVALSRSIWSVFTLSRSRGS